MDHSRPPQSGNLPVPLPQASVKTQDTYLSRLGKYLEMALSIPERSARALGAMTGGITLMLGRVLVPASIRNSNTYRFTVGMFQTFLIRNIAGMEEVRTELPSLPDAFLRRKLVGSGLEAAGLLTMHFSPVWVFALASDTARGGQVFLGRLVHYLKHHGVIAQDSNPESVEQVLLSIQDMAARGAAAFDMPPLNVHEISTLATELRDSTRALAVNSSSLLPSFDSLWNQITEVATSEKLSVEEVLGILAINAGKSRDSAQALGQTSADLLDELVLQEYRDTLAGIRQTGALVYLRQNMEPYFNNALSHFDFERQTVTQSWYLRAREALRRALFRN